MEITIEEKGTRQFYRETVSTLFQYRSLIRKPERKPRDFISSMIAYCLLEAFILILIILEGMFWGFEGYMYVAMGVTVVAIAICAASAIYANSLVGKLQEKTNSASATKIIIDDDGVEIDMDDADRTRHSWDSIAFVKVQKESVCFIPKNGTSSVIAVSTRYEDEVLNEVRKCCEGMPIYPA